MHFKANAFCKFAIFSINDTGIHTIAYKIYFIYLLEQDGNSTVVSVSKRGHTSHNERYHDVEDYERKVRKRRARLISAAEESFTHIRRMREEVLTGTLDFLFHVPADLETYHFLMSLFILLQHGLDLA